MAFKQKIYETDAEKKKDFRRGIALFFGLNILMGLCSWGVAVLFYSSLFTTDFTNNPVSNLYSTLSCILGALPLFINVGLILFFAFTRSQIALGMVAGFGIAFLITICLGVIFTAWCFYALGNSGL